MADKKKNTSQSQMAEPKARASAKEQSKTEKVVARERDEQERKKVRRENKEQKPAPRKSSSTLPSRLRRYRLVRFILDAYYELRYKVTWPTFEEARNMTIAVLLLSAAAGVVLGLADLGLLQIFKILAGK
jgi:preprotein translocase SecE subunit